MFGRRNEPSGRRAPARATTPAGDEDAGEGEAPAPPALPPRLVDLAADWLALIPALRRAGDLPDPARVREHAADLRTGFERRAKQAGFAEDDIRAAVFCLTALLDETVRRSRGRARDEWLARPLQLEWFETSNAGVEFYERLEEVRKDRSKRIQALEVAACCLALGFEGRLATSTREARFNLVHDLMLDVAAVRDDGKLPLAPHVISKDRLQGRAVAEVPRWIMVVAFVAALLLIWVGITQLSHLEAVRAIHDLAPRNP
ncbi:MAG TPA: type IVB secretion system protein IcmH/DotU [Candidatus Eisenbacteria bacterium]